MIGKMTPHPDQIRWYAKSALNGFETLEPEDAIENARFDLRSLLAYLDRADDTVRILLVEPIESRIDGERLIGHSETGDFPDLKVVRL